MHHADKLVSRIIFLEGFPNMQTLAPLRIGENIKEVLEADRAAEHEARDACTRGRDICHDAKDYVSVEIFEELLEDEEGHIDFIETQLDLLAKFGEQSYGCHTAEKQRADVWSISSLSSHHIR
jgi:bacterioferritin